MTRSSQFWIPIGQKVSIQIFPAAPANHLTLSHASLITHTCFVFPLLVIRALI